MNGSIVFETNLSPQIRVRLETVGDDIRLLLTNAQNQTFCLPLTTNGMTRLRALLLDMSGLVSGQESPFGGKMYTAWAKDLDERDESDWGGPNDA